MRRTQGNVQGDYQDVKITKASASEAGITRHQNPLPSILASWAQHHRQNYAPQTQFSQARIFISCIITLRCSALFYDSIHCLVPREK